jgi:hypothetical protein
MDWEGILVLWETDSLLRSILARRPLNQLIGLSEDQDRAVREALQTELERGLGRIAPDLGAKILGIRLGNLAVDDDVTQQWVKAWKARWENWSADRLAYDEASYVYQFETVKAEAQMQMIARFTRELQDQIDSKAIAPQAIPQMVLMRLFSVLDRADFASSSRIFFPTQTFHALESVRRSLGFQTEANGVAIQLVADPRRIPLHGQADLAVSVTDAWGNPAPDGTSVEFTTSLGTVSPASAPTIDGVASSTLIADNQSGSATIIALSGSRFSREKVQIG